MRVRALGNYSSGSGNVTGGGRAEAVPERPAAGVRRGAPDHYSRGSEVAKEGARGGVAGGGMTAGAHRRRDERCRDFNEAFFGCDGSKGSWRNSLRWVKRTSHEICWVAKGLTRCSQETVFGGKSFFESLPSPHKTSNQQRLLLASPPPPTPPPPIPPPAPRSGSDANASGGGSFGGGSSQDEDPLDPSPPSPQLQRGPRTLVNHYLHHRHSHHSPHNRTSAAGIAAPAANALLARNLSLPANAAFTRRQRLRWA